MKKYHLTLFAYAIFLMANHLYGAQEMKRVFAEIKKFHKLSSGTDLNTAPTPAESRKTGQIPDLVTNSAHKKHMKHQPLPPGKCLSPYHTLLKRKPTELTLNTNPTEEAIKLTDLGLTHLHESYESSENAEFKVKQRELAINYFGDSLSKDHNARVIAILYLIFCKPRLAGVKIPENPYFLMPIQYEGPECLKSYPKLQIEFETLAELSKRSSGSTE
jgi:hypothetical protein